MPQWQPESRISAPAVHDGEVVVEAPPDPPRAVPPNPIMRLLPVLMIVAVAGMMVLFVSSGVGSARNPVSLLFPAMMLLSSVGMMAYGGRGGTRTADIDESRKDYLAYLARLRAEMMKSACRQRESLLWQHPHPGALWTLAGTRRMWERGRADSDFCHVRVGVGVQRGTTKLSSPELGPVDQLEPVSAMALRDFIRTHSTVDALPIALALGRFSAVVVDGDDDAVRALLRAMVCQVAVLHSPRLVAVAAVTDDATERQWDWLKWLPHHQHPHLVDAGGPVRMRFRTLADALAVPSAGQMVVIIDGGDVTAAERVVGRGDVTILARESGAWAGVPSLRLRCCRSALAVVGEIDEVFAQPDMMTVAQAKVCARSLAPYRAESDGSARAEPGGGWAALLGVGDPGSIQHDALWPQLSAQKRLRVPVGVTADGSAVEVDLKEAAENGMGPHGLCVGATGSGKSEFLRTLTLGLVATHPPESLNLVLVDFKGGATFLGFEQARHVAALITNLSTEAHLVARMKDALAGEMNRRQELLRSAGSFPSVAEYERARAAGVKLARLPTLLVIVDEFCELLTQHPDFAEMFVAIGRLGRSLRMHLLLATQRLEEGRLRGLESHLSYRICLKTFSANESRAAIGVPDAFHLPATPGAAYLRVGSDEPVAFQTAYVSAPHISHHDIREPNAPAAQVFTAAPMGVAVTPKRTATARTVLETVLRRLAGCGPPAHRVWLPPLSESETLDALLSGNHVGTLAVPIGVVDRPFEQRRDPLLVELAGSAGNVAVIGAPQSGKSTTVRTLVTALAATHAPDEMQFYCLDLGGGALSALADLPHVGSVAVRSDPDLLRRTVAEVTAVVRSREAAFRRLRIDSMADYRRRRAAAIPTLSDDPFGDVFLVVDGWASLREDFEALEAPITTLAAQGLSFGVHVVVTASRWAELRPAMKDQIGTRLELRLGDTADSELNRKAAQHVPHGRPGRGITCDGRQMLVALPRLDGRRDNSALSEAIADAAQRIRGRFGDGAAPAVRLLPSRVDHADVLAADPPMTQVVLGLDEDELAPVTIDFGVHQHVLILGDNECGKTATLRLVCGELVRTATPEKARLIIVDYRRTLLGVVESEHLAGYAVSGAVLAGQLPPVVDQLRARIPGPEVDQRQLRTRSWWTGPDLFLIIDDYDLIATSTGNPLDPIIELLPQAKDLGLHLIVARRSGGAGRALFEPLLARLRELGCLGLMMSASPDEGVLLGTSRPRALPPGRASLVSRAGERVVQVAWVPPCP